MICNIDGCCKGNPGDSAIGGLARFDCGVVTQFSRYVGVTTNNEAEYLALIELLESIIQNSEKIKEGEKIIIRSDSQLVVKQMQGEFAVKNERIKKFYDKAISLVSCLNSQVVFELISREFNKDADKLANLGLRGSRSK